MVICIPVYLCSVVPFSSSLAFSRLSSHHLPCFMLTFMFYCSCSFQCIISLWSTYFYFPVHSFYVPLPMFLYDCQARSLFLFLYQNHTFPRALTLKKEAAWFSIMFVATYQSRLHVVTSHKIVIFTVTADFSWVISLGWLPFLRTANSFSSLGPIASHFGSCYIWL